MRMLGGFSVSLGASIIEEGEWHLRKAAGLVKLLALEPGHRMHREQMMDVLWPELDEKAQANNLRYALHHARRTLALASDSDTASRLLPLRGELLELGAEGSLAVDVEAFEEAAKTARGSRDVGAYRAALDLYAGELLPEDRYETWAEDRREELRGMHLSLLLELAALYEEHGEYDAAVTTLRKVLASEPAHEEAHAQLMRLCALSGRRGEALEQYERLRKALKRECAAEPSAESRRLYEEIKAERSPPVRLPRQEEGRPREEPRQEDGSRRHNLPNTSTSFVGREQERLEVKRLLYMTRLLTLIGAGGSGKTRLALEVARNLVGAYPDGVWLVELAGLSDPVLVPQEVADALKVREQPGRPILDTLVGALREKKLLVVLDNCEHLIDAAASLVEKLLSSCAGLRILATSREPLGVAGEANCRVPSLTVPDARGGIAADQNLARYEAIRLFVDRARSRRPTFAMTSQNARAVAEVCRKLEGIPLAIELAAARMAVLSVEQIVRRLEGSIKLLTVGGGQMADPRHRTLRGALDWSYELLDEPERRLFERLSVFAGGWTLEAAEAVGAGEGIEEENVLDLLSELIDKSLVVAELGQEWDGAAAMRYRMLEPVRQYAREKLEDSGQSEQTKRRHAEWYLTLAEEADKESSGWGHVRWLQRLETEHDNLRAALRWSLDEGDAELGLRLAGALWLFWFMRGHSVEGWRWLEEAISLGGPPTARAKALNGGGWIVMLQGDFGTAKTLLEESLALYRELKDEEGIASSLNFLGYVALLGHREDIPVAALLEEALALKPQLKNRRTIANILVFAGLDALLRGDWDEAVALHEEALALYREIGDKWGIIICLTNLGLMAAALEQHARATALLRELMQVSREVDDKLGSMYSFFGLACVVSSKGYIARAARLWGISEAIREAAGLQLPPLTLSVLKYEDRLADARARLGEAAFEEAWAEGKAMTTEQAVEYAFAEEESCTPSVPTPERPSADEPTDNLTRREQEVAVLVSRGLTNRQISTELRISERTAGNHVARILRKLGLRSRAQIASWTTERQLLVPEPE